MVRETDKKGVAQFFKVRYCRIQRINKLRRGYMNFYEFAGAHPIITFFIVYIAGDVIISVATRFGRK